MLSHAIFPCFPCFPCFLDIIKSNIYWKIPCFPCFPCFHFYKFPCFPCFPWFPMVSHGFIFHDFPCFHGELSYNFCCPMLAWKAWEFPHENHGILLWLHAPWFSRESMEFFPCFFHGFSMVFPWFSHAFSTRVGK